MSVPLVCLWGWRAGNRVLLPACLSLCGDSPRLGLNSGLATVCVCVCVLTFHHGVPPFVIADPFVFVFVFFPLSPLDGMVAGVAEEKGFTNVRVVTADANHFQVWGWGPPSV